MLNPTLNPEAPYQQTGGIATITNTITLCTTNLTYGTAQFVVDTNATLVLQGPGFVKSGTSEWSTNLLVAGNLGFAGTIVCAPQAGVTEQRLLAFGADLGPALALELPDNYRIGKLSVADVGEGTKVTIQAAGNESPNALYIEHLAGVTAANAAELLDSAINVYYDAVLNPELQRASFALNGGGTLLPYNKIPQGTLLLLK